MENKAKTVEGWARLKESNEKNVIGEQ